MFAVTGSNSVLNVVRVASTSVVWSQNKATGDNFQNPAVAHYGFQLEEGITDWVQTDNLFVSTTSLTLTPNTAYTMKAYLKDDLGSVSPSVQVTTMTLQATPSAVTV